MMTLAIPQNTRGRKPLRGEKADDRFPLRLTPEMRADLDAESETTGVSVTEIIRRRIEGAPSKTEKCSEEISSAVRNAFQEFLGQGIPLSLDGISREQLADVAGELGFLDPAHLLKALANKAVKSPSAIKSLLSDEIDADADMRARAEYEARTGRKIQ